MPLNSHLTSVAGKWHLRDPGGSCPHLVRPQMGSYQNADRLMRHRPSLATALFLGLCRWRDESGGGGRAGMGMKDKQTPSRCWEQGSSPCRMCMWLSAAPAQPAPTPELGDHGGQGRAESSVPFWLSPSLEMTLVPPEQWDTISPTASVVALVKFVRGFCCKVLHFELKTPHGHRGTALGMEL